MIRKEKEEENHSYLGQYELKTPDRMICILGHEKTRKEATRIMIGLI